MAKVLAVAAAALALAAGDARAGDGYHPFKDFGKDTAAPPSLDGTARAPAPSAVTTVNRGDPGSATGHADPHPYHPFRDFGKETAAAKPLPGRPSPTDPIAAPSNPPRGDDDKEAWAEVKAFDQKDEEEQRDDAAANFETVVRSYLAQEATPEGCWAYKEKGKKMCLALVAVDGAHAKKAGKGRFSAVAAMKDVRGKARPALRFTVDFSGPSWEVVDIERLTK